LDLIAMLGNVAAADGQADEVLTHDIARLTHRLRSAA
jgi:hypothetical protein